MFFIRKVKEETGRDSKFYVVNEKLQTLKWGYHPRFIISYLPLLNAYQVHVIYWF
jgi:hypothetical protein